MAQVLTIEPDKKQALIKKAQAYYDADELDKGFEVIQDFLAENPSDAQGLSVAAAILKKAGKTPIAYSLAKRAVELRPDRHETWLAVGFCAQHLWLLDEALSSYRKGLQRATSSESKALFEQNICSVLIDQGKFKEATPHAIASLEHSEKPQARHNLGLCHLGQRNWREGWANYSASVGTFNRQVWKYNDPPEPQWDGTNGKRVVVYGEQGIGDEISFCSMIPDAVKDARIVIDCDPRLQGLFGRSFPEAHVYGTRGKKQVNWKKEDREIDASISMGELGKIYRNEEAQFPGTPYLSPCPERTTGWKAAFAAKKKPVIGIAWSGGNWLNGAVNRFLPLKDWGPIFGAVDAHWVSLQYRDAKEEIEGFPVVQYPWATLTKDYDDTAALVAACDLVVCVQTSVGHLAGALGVPVWCMVPQNSQWRYGANFEDMPWYKSMRVFKARGEWGPVVQKIAGELRGKFNN
jgi:tetratricopeptide (TPR) repeat protein